MAALPNISVRHVQVDGRQCDFLGYSGHEAFTAMRARGAQVTVSLFWCGGGRRSYPQTVEAINTRAPLKCPSSVAINKSTADATLSG